MKRVKILILIVFINFLLINNTSAQQVGKIILLQGKVDILKEGKPPAVLAKINDSVNLNDIIRTKTDSRVEILFNDGTIIKIAPRSRIDISEYFADAQSIKVTINVPRGKIGAFVAKESIEKIKASPQANKFEIKTPIAVAGVRGTNYIIAHYPTYSTVTVITGRVYCYNIQFPEKVVELTQGQITYIKEGAPPSSPQKITSDELKRQQRDFISIKTEAKEQQTHENSLIRSFFEEKSSILGEKPSLETTLEPKNIPHPQIKTETIIPITETTKTTNITEDLKINVSLQSIEPGSIKLNYKVSANRDITLQYRVKKSGNYQNWIDVNTNPQELIYFSIPDLEEGYNYQIDIKAKDSEGNIKEWTSPEFYPILKNFTGNIKTDTNSSSTITGSVAGALGLNKGIAKLTVSSPVSFDSLFIAGGGDSSKGYWLLKGPSNSSYFKLITPSYLFKGSGISSLTIEDNGLKSITTGSWISANRLTLSGKFIGRDHHYYANTNKIDEVVGSEQAVVFIGRADNLVLPENIDTTVTYNTENYGIGYIPTSNVSPSLTWGIFQENSESIIKLKGYAGGIGDEITKYAIYSLYIAQDTSAGIIKGFPDGTNQRLYEQIRILDIEPSFTFKKKAKGYTTISTWTDYIKGYYQGFFTFENDTRILSRQNIENTSYGMIGSAILSLKKGNYIEPWGIFGIELGGSFSPSQTIPKKFKLEFGGDSWDNTDASSTTPDYWLGWSYNETVSSNKEMFGDFKGKFITPTHYGAMEGKILGKLNNDKWVGVVLGSYEPILQLSHLSNIISDPNKSKIFKDQYSATQARINAYLGGDNFWSSNSSSLYSIGKIIDDSNHIDFSGQKGYLWYAPVNWSSGLNRYTAYIGGRFAEKIDTNYNLAAYLIGIYSDSTNKGIFVGKLSTDGTSNVLTREKRFFLEGENMVKAVTVKQGSIPSTVSQWSISNPTIDSNYYGMTIQSNESYIFTDTNLNDYTFGAGIIGIGGSYNIAPTGSWEITYKGKWDDTGDFEAILKGTQWGNENSIYNTINGNTYGYFLDNTGTPLRTGIFVGETIGTFDPTNKYWQTITLGKLFATEQFLSMACPSGVCNTSGTNFTEEQEKLRKLNIPVVEVGRVSFSGSGNNLSVNMNNVIFFSTQTGQKPILWSTANITGTYTDTPTLNQSITLNATSGALGSVNFTPTYWLNGNWSATIANDTGSPIQLSNSSYSINMQGAASGSYENGNFTGSASGIVK